MIVSLSTSEVLLRLLCAFVAGALLGLERETHGRPAGLRTTVLTCVAAALAMILSHEFAITYSHNAGGILRSDPGRLAAGVLSGIGFLGAGTIFRSGSIVRGVTTAAVLWFSTVLGLVFGSGQWLLGFVGLALAVTTLIVLPFLDMRIPHGVYTRLTITTQGAQADDTELKNLLERAGLEIADVSFAHDYELQRRVTHFEIRINKSDLFETSLKLSRDIETLPHVIGMKWDARSKGG